MHVIEVRNVNEALTKGLRYLVTAGLSETSRNGAVLVAPGPVTTVYNNPTERVLFSRSRDANPFFHLMEALWMVAGRRDLEFPQRFISNFGRFSDDGKTLNGAYGWRWRSHFGFDQLAAVATELSLRPDSRRAVLAMWDPREDLQSESLDLPCNTHIYFDLRGGVLNMTVCNRSNDAIWGAYGANAVHMSFLQEFMAASLHRPVGAYRQISNNFHIYTDVFESKQVQRLIEEGFGEDLYATLDVKPMPLLAEGETFDALMADLTEFMFLPQGMGGFRTLFFRDTVAPMWDAHSQRKENIGQAIETATKIGADDWRIASVNWLLRRKENRNA